MAELAWEKPRSTVSKPAAKRVKFIIVGAILMGAIGFLVLTGTASSARFFITVNEVAARPDLAGKTVKMTGAVIGSTIKFDPDTKSIYFTLANITDDNAEIEREGGLASALHLAVIDPNARHIDVVVPNQPMPDLLKDEAQAIVTGKVGSDGVFTADELLLKCPSKYASDLPNQASAQQQ
ncbi:MAG TPA: cytochrome c maturation protein CcmE [Aggregatilineales bacterium]|nr:cytochrome c maturation protein CcmE [Aggregatilineales bacterium]